MFLSYRRINLSQKSQFFVFVVSQFTITRSRIPKIGTHHAFINSYIESKFQLSRFYCLQVSSKSILICRNSRKKSQKQRYYTRSREVLIIEKMAHYTFIWELKVNNFYQRNCVDLKPVPIICFIFHEDSGLFQIRILLDSVFWHAHLYLRSSMYSLKF